MTEPWTFVDRAVPFQAAFPPLALPHTGRASLPPHRAGSAPPSANAPPARVKNRAKYLALGQQDYSAWGERDSTPTRRESALLPRACIPARKRAGLALVERSRPNHVVRSCFRRERPSRAGGAQQPQPQLRRSSSAVSARETRAARASSLCAGSRALPARGSQSPRARVMLSPLGRVALP